MIMINPEYAATTSTEVPVQGKSLPGNKDARDGDNSYLETPRKIARGARVLADAASKSAKKLAKEIAESGRGRMSRLLDHKNHTGKAISQKRQLGLGLIFAISAIITAKQIMDYLSHLNKKEPGSPPSLFKLAEIIAGAGVTFGTLNTLTRSDKMGYNGMRSALGGLGVLGALHALNSTYKGKGLAAGLLRPFGLDKEARNLMNELEYSSPASNN